jgi:copper homeostasis protein
VDSPEGVAAALAHGADRIELCSALELGGLTPSQGLMEMAASLVKHEMVPPPVVVAMIRPRAGDFCYSGMELDVMKRDIEAAQRIGLSGVVFGATIAMDGDIDVAAMRTLVAAAKAPHPTPFSVTLHRAIDLSPDPVASLQTLLKELPPGSFDRILTSGGSRTAWEGRDTIARLVEAAIESSLVVMAGAGVNVGNVSELVAATGVTEVHASCSRGSSSGSSVEGREEAMDVVKEKSVAFGFTSGGERVRETDGAKVEALATIVHTL